MTKGTVMSKIEKLHVEVDGEKILTIREEVTGARD
jgi:hypothetical protein